MADHYVPLFREAHGLPCATLANEFPADDSRVMNLHLAALYFKIPAETLEKWWVATFYPTLGLADPPVTAVAMADGTDAADPSAHRLRAYRVMRSSGYPELTDAELDALLEFCRVRKLNPLAGHVYPTWRRDADGARIIEFRLGIDGMWEVARRGGGFRKNRTTHATGPDGRPVTTTVDVWREVDGVVQRFRAEVVYAARYPGPGKSDVWDRDPWRMCEKNGEVAALRKAYPELLAGVYEVDEGGFNPVRGADGPSRSAARQDLGLDPYRRVPWPESRQQFELALVDCGVREEEARRRLSQALHAELPDCSGPAFYREALRLVYADPPRWRARHPEPCE
jgi:phage recombination protein Bet